MKKITRTIQKIQLLIGLGSISIFFIAIILQILSRYTKFTATWTGEMATYSFIWFVFMGAGVMTYENKHFAFTTIGDKLSARKKQILYIVISVIVMLFGAAIFYYGIVICKLFWNYRWNTLPWIKMGYMWLSLPILGGSIVLYSIEHIYEYVQKIKLLDSDKGGM